MCDDPFANSEPEILAAYSHAPGESVAANGQIKVWITDELPPYIAEGEQIDETTGRIVVPGDLAGLNFDGYLNEPTLYLTSATTSMATGFYPQWVMGDYNNMPSAGPDITKLFGGTVPHGPAPEPLPASATGVLPQTYNSEFIWEVSEGGTGEVEVFEFIWEVSEMQLEPGSYSAEFVVHDGDLDRAVGCIAIDIAPPVQ